jgi:hypothetical protein
MEDHVLPDDPVKDQLQEIKDLVEKAAQPFVGEPNDLVTRKAFTDAILAVTRKLHIHAFEPTSWTLEDLKNPEVVQHALDGLEQHHCSCGKQALLSTRQPYAITEALVQMAQSPDFYAILDYTKIAYCRY